MTNLDQIDLDLVCGGTPATYPNTCGRGAVDGALAGVAGGASMLPFAALSGPISPISAGAVLGGAGAFGAATGCVNGMWSLYKARNPLELK
jgi:hypothetical protein